MNRSDPDSRYLLKDRIHREMMDNIDEELELELDDSRLGTLRTEIGDPAQEEPLDRHFYFKELLRLQGELVKLQDWVQTNKLKVVVIFEGRDAPGKGGVIKRALAKRNRRWPCPSFGCIETERETQSFEKPPWVGKEVTLDRCFGNSYLARHPFVTWSETQRSALEGSEAAP